VGEREAITISFAALTDIGLIRAANEDTFHVSELGGRGFPGGDGERERISSPHGFVLGVYDGMGGRSGGDAASQDVARVVHAVTSTSPRPGTSAELRERLSSAVETAGRDLFMNASRDRTRLGTATTATVAALLDEHLHVAHVGDSRAYLLRGRRLTQLTRDDTLLNMMLESGELDAERAASFEHRNVITRALGLQEKVSPATRTVKLRLGDALLLCTDGLSGLVDDATIRATMLRHFDPGVAGRVLIDEALRAGGTDNVTMIVARFDGAWLRPPTREELQP
jgi:protein phosphatase